MDNDSEGIGTKVLPKLVVTHVADKNGSNAIEGMLSSTRNDNFISDNSLKKFLWGNVI